MLPRRLKIEFRVHRRVANRNQTTGEVRDFEKILKDYTRHIVFDPRIPEILLPGIAMLPLAPTRPEAAGMGGGPAGEGGQGPGGGGPFGIDKPGGAGPGLTTAGGGINIQVPGDTGRRPGGQGGGRRPTLPRGGSSSGGFDLGALLRGAGIPIQPSGSRK